MPPLVLLPSPLVGPAVWRPVSGCLKERGWSEVVCAPVERVRNSQDVLDRWLETLPDRDVVLVVHSNAGAYVPVLTARHRIAAVVFVDALLPPKSGEMPLAPPALLDTLSAKVDDSGLLPRWTDWWDDSDVAALFPDGDTRRRVEQDEPQLPLTYFSGSLPVPHGWDDVPAAYLAFGSTYEAARERAAEWGWPVATLEGQHLHQLVNPDEVATEISRLLHVLGVPADDAGG